MEENRKFQEKTRLSNLAKQNEALRRQQEDLKQQLSQTVRFPLDIDSWVYDL